MMAQLLVLASRYVRICGSPDGYIHVGDFLSAMCARGHIAGKPGGDYAKLKHWRLLQQKLGASAPGRRRAGQWYVTADGHNVVDGKSRVLLYLWISKDEVIGSEQPTVDIVTLVGGEDEYRRLMAVEFGPLLPGKADIGHAV